MGERSKSSSAETPDSPDRCTGRRFRDYLRNHASAELEPPPTARRRRASGHAERLRDPAGGGRQSDGRTDPQTQPCTSVAHTPTTPPTRGAAGLAQVRVRALRPLNTFAPSGLSSRSPTRSGTFARPQLNGRDRCAPPQAGGPGERRTSGGRAREHPRCPPRRSRVSLLRGQLQPFDFPRKRLSFRFSHLLARFSKALLGDSPFPQILSSFLLNYLCSLLQFYRNWLSG